MPVEAGRHVDATSFRIAVQAERGSLGPGHPAGPAGAVRAGDCVLPNASRAQVQCGAAWWQQPGDVLRLCRTSLTVDGPGLDGYHLSAILGAARVEATTCTCPSVRVLLRCTVIARSSRYSSLRARASLLRPVPAVATKTQQLQQRPRFRCRAASSSNWRLVSAGLKMACLSLRIAALASLFHAVRW